MGKNLKGKELGKGLYQRKDGRYEARIFVRGTGKTFSIYGTNLQHLKKERNAYLANVSPGIAGYDPRISVSKWYEKWMLIYVVHSVKATTLSNYVNGFERVREYIGYMRLIEVRPTHILDMIKGLEEEIALAEKENRDPNLMDVHPHIFRHTFVTRCMQSGMDAATVKKIDGHSDEKMTNYYTHIEEEHIDDEYELYIQNTEQKPDFANGDKILKRGLNI